MYVTLSSLIKYAYISLLTSSEPVIKESEYPELTGLKWLVTGATGGIGYEVVKILLRQGAEVWLVGRSDTKLHSVLLDLKQHFPSAKLHSARIDYLDLSTVKPAVEQLFKETNHFNGIIHNAGVMLVPKGSVTKQGYEETIGVNNFATTLLQDLLDPLIVNVPNGRIVWLSSLAHMGAPPHGLDVTLPETGSPTSIYCMSKALDYIASVQWTKNHPTSSVKSISVHPGVIRSDLTRHMSGLELKFQHMIQWDTGYGARTVAAAALYDNAANNDYYVPFGKPGLVRADIYEAARNERGVAAMDWIEGKIAGFK